MSSIGSMLNAARTALLTHQGAMTVVGHNIANAETEGYSRQDLLLSASTPLSTTYGNFGTGVSAVTVSRARDGLVDQDIRAQSAPASGFGTRYALMSRIEAILGEPSDNGLADAFDEFWNAWSDLASRPANDGAKAVVQQRALALTDRFNSYAKQLDALGAETRTQIGDTVSQVNRLTSQIAALNAQIVPAESGGHTANDLRDTRDMLIDELSTLVPVSVIDRADGSDQVMLGGRPLVDGPVAHPLTRSGGVPPVVSFAGESSPLLTMGGRLGALLDMATVDIPAVRGSLNQLASALITDVNALHVAAWSPPSGGAGNWDPLLGPTGSGIPFFDPAPANAGARTIRLSAAVAADPGAIASGNALDAPGNNAVALGIAALRDFSPSAPSNSFSTAYQGLVSTIAGATRTANDSASVAQTLADHAIARRAEVSGVSTDEELLRLMRHQQAYAAAAKVIQTVDEMSAVLLSLKA